MSVQGFLLSASFVLGGGHGRGGPGRGDLVGSSLMGLSGENADDRERCVDIGRPACESAQVPRPLAAGSPTRQIAVLPATHD
jgi:hypothetical protein